MANATIKMALRFAGKVAIVTGSSNGIGRATAILFAEEGASVTITGRSQQALDESLDLLIKAGAKQENILQVQGDMLEEAFHQKLVDETIKKFGKLDILVNNAGGVKDNAGMEKVGLAVSLDQFDYVIQLNLKAVLSLSRIAFPHLTQTKGEIVNISSIASYPFASSTMPYYSISKAGLDSLTRSMAIEYLKQGIRVNSVNPGFISTAIMQKQGVNKDAQKLLEDAYSDTKFIPLGRVGRAREIAELIAFLCDRSKSEFIIGQCICADGGSTLLNPIMQGFESFEKVFEKMK